MQQQQTTAAHRILLTPLEQYQQTTAPAHKSEHTQQPMHAATTQPVFRPLPGQQTQLHLSLLSVLQTQHSDVIHPEYLQQVMQQQQTTAAHRILPTLLAQYQQTTAPAHKSE